MLLESNSFTPWATDVNARAVAEMPQGPLSADHRRQLTLATARAKAIRIAAGVAALNGWTTGVIAALSMPFAVFSLVGFMVAAGLVVVTYNEFIGRRRLLAFDPNAATLLGMNQLGLLTVVTVYCLWMIFAGLTSPNPLAVEMAAHPEYGDILGRLDGFETLYEQLIVVVYGAVIVLSLVFQGLNAFYYFTRRRHIESYLRETPSWVLDLQRSMTPA